MVTGVLYPDMGVGRPGTLDYRWPSELSSLLERSLPEEGWGHI